LTTLRTILWQLLLWGAFPAWMLAGAADWLCHRRTHIERTSGPRESLLHLLLYAEIVLPLVLALWFELTAAMLLVMTLGVGAHLLTSWWDTSVAQPRRHIAPIEQMIHSWLEMMPLFALLIAGALHATELSQPRWRFELRDPATPVAARTAILLALALGLACILEELWRALRAVRVSAPASAPAVDPPR
jgi:hypothetical protein